ncbi:MAG: Zn-dependent hydrolase, glyoxylase [Candidatus Atelocyanobacterium thalassa isolate SIO64986]|uniref:Zn-dependent hydrolase, glyoxylase n=1 Tax=Candidatus Atelocyanobacterium thalassa isolate SIO64986 TaxID=1527444 RepID=A0A086CHC6_9CHRO|nr:MAG: Zn-dependent hydrolase, glyoxylase [Candidatus Atelocyanobacterium thalassa isolate SIO64986]
MLFRQLFDKESSTYTYLVADPHTREAILVDPVFENVARDIKLIKELNLILKYCLETHIHADHITGTGKLRELTRCLGIIPKNEVIKCADRFIDDKETLLLGNTMIEAMYTPGHTDSHCSYLINQTLVLTGDALLIRGCGRTDFQSGDAGILYDSVTMKLFSLPDEILVYPGHDYQGFTVSTIGEERKNNPRFTGVERKEFINLMSKIKLSQPSKIKQAIPINKNCGNILFS